MKFVDVSILKGKILKDIKIEGTESILFIDKDDIEYEMFHDYDCCENVYIEDICGDINNLIGSKIIMAEEVINRDLSPLNKYDESYTWTFYKFATVKGYVTIRWYGESNGYYSERVDFVINDKEEY